MLAQQSDRLTVGSSRCSLANPRLGVRVCSLHAHENTRETGLLIEVQDVPVTDDVTGSNGGNQLDGHSLRDQGFQERPPQPGRRRWVFISEIDEADAVDAVQPADLGRGSSWIAVTPTGPKTAL